MLTRVTALKIENKKPWQGCVDPYTMGESVKFLFTIENSLIFLKKLYVLYITKAYCLWISNFGFTLRGV